MSGNELRPGVVDSSVEIHHSRWYRPHRVQHGCGDGINYQTPWSGELFILEWEVVAFVLFRHWPLAQTEPAEAISPPVRLESTI